MAECHQKKNNLMRTLCGKIQFKKQDLQAMLKEYIVFPNSSSVKAWESIGPGSKWLLHTQSNGRHTHIPCVPRHSLKKKKSRANISERCQADKNGKLRLSSAEQLCQRSWQPELIRIVENTVTEFCINIYFCERMDNLVPTG